MKPVFPALLLTAVLFLSGCASKRFTYQTPPPRTSPGGFSVVVALLDDQRNNRSLDRVFSKDLAVDIRVAVAAELEGTGRYRSVTVGVGDSAETNADLVVTVTLRRLEWEVPGYGGTLAGSAVAAGAFGGLGMLVYGSSDTEVNGHAEVVITITRVEGNRSLLNREYVGRHSESTSKLSCDAPSTKARVAIRAFEEAMRKLRADL